jgi:hypothetical protein
MFVSSMILIILEDLVFLSQVAVLWKKIFFPKNIPSKNLITLCRSRTARAALFGYLFGTLKSFFVIKRNPVVRITPDDNKTTVFVRGRPYLSGGIIPRGGQVQPISTDGERLK